MVREYNTVKEATRLWVGEFNAIPRGMIEKLMKEDPEDWSEITTPSYGDRVYVYSLSDEAATSECNGMVEDYDKQRNLYSIKLDDGTFVSITADSFDVWYDDMLPIWGTMWSFGEDIDNWWLEEDGIRLMSDCGFRIFQNEEFGFFFGIDGAGYDFYEAHWEPLYRARGLRWHNDKAEYEYQMWREVQF